MKPRIEKKRQHVAVLHCNGRRTYGCGNSVEDAIEDAYVRYKRMRRKQPDVGSQVDIYEHGQHTRTVEV